MEAKIKEELRKITGVDENSKRDLFSLAKENDPQIKKQFDQNEEKIKEVKKEASLNSLMELMTQWGLTVNMGWQKVLWVCNHGRITTTYEMAMIASNDDKSDYKTALKKVCSLHYDLRLKFNKEIKSEELFKYTALNIGNLGLQSFGEFCFYFEPKIVLKLNGLTFIKGNSLDAYADKNNDLDLDRLLKDISSKDLIKELAATKHLDEIINETSKEVWPKVICNDKCYIEGVVIDELGLAHVSCVKINSDYDSQFTKVAADLRYEEEASTIDGDMLNNYLNAKNELSKKGVTIQIA